MNAQEEQLPYGTKITCPGGEVFAYYPKPESTDGERSADMEIWWKCLLICGDSYW